MSKIDEKREKELRRILWDACDDCEECQESDEHCMSCPAEDETGWEKRLRKAAELGRRLGWEERNGTAPHLHDSDDGEFTITCPHQDDWKDWPGGCSKHVKEECAKAGGACRSFAGEEGGSE